MKRKETNRGFGIYKFKDSYGAKCSLQKSSSAMDDFIWLGTVEARMHLSRKDVKKLLPILKKFVDTGEI